MNIMRTPIVIFFTLLSALNLKAYAEELQKACINSDSCVYHIGESLEFYVFGIGSDWPEIGFTKSIKENQFYAVLELRSSCLRVVAGEKSEASGGAVAFVHLKTGTIYSPKEARQECPLN